MSLRGLVAHARTRPVELGVVALLALALPGLGAGIVAPAPHQSFVHPSSGIRVSASSSFTRDNYDTAYLVDGRSDDPRLAWASQRDAAPWVKLELPAPRRLARIVAHGIAERGAVQPPRQVSAACDGGKATALGQTNVPHVLAADLDGASCTVVLLRFADSDLAARSIGLTEVELVEAER